MKTKEFSVIEAKFYQNRLYNFLIAKVLQLSEVNRRLYRYESKLALLDVNSDKLQIFLELILEDMSTHWKLYDPVKSLENLKTQSRPSLLVANHPLGGRDGVSVLACLYGILGKDQFKVLVNEFLFHIPYICDMTLPISTLKASRRNFFRQLGELESVIEQRQSLFLFPAGLCSRMQSDENLKEMLTANGTRELQDTLLANPLFEKLQSGWQHLSMVYDLPWRHSFLRLARKHKVDVIFLHISGQNSASFYRLARLRKKLGLRFNWEMLLLPREFLYNRGGEKADKQNLNITVGAVLKAEELQQWPRQNDELWAQFCRHYIYQLPIWFGTEGDAGFVQRSCAELLDCHRLIISSKLPQTQGTLNNGNHNVKRN